MIPYGIKTVDPTELQHEGVLRLGRVAVALGLVEEAEIKRVGGYQCLGCRLEHGIKTYGCRSEILGNEGVADRIAVNTAGGIEHIEGGSVAGDGVERES